MKKIVNMIKDFIFYGVSSDLEGLKNTSDRKHGIFTFNGVKYAYSNYSNADEISLTCII